MTMEKRRLDNVFRRLTPKQRAMMALKYVKQRAKPEKAIWSTASSEDLVELRRIVSQLSAVTALVPDMYLLRSYVSELDLLCRLISTRRDLGKDIRFLGCDILNASNEPVTESAYRLREQELRAALEPVRELADVAVNRDGVFTDADYTTESGERMLIEGAWDRVRADMEGELIRLFREGTLTGEEDETGIRIRSGSFYDWFGESQPVYSIEGLEYEVVPDDQVDLVAVQQRTRRAVKELTSYAPGRDDLPLELDSEPPGLSEIPSMMLSVDVERRDVIALRDGIQLRWRELRAYEIVVAEVATEDFCGVDPLYAEARNLLQEIRDHLVALREKLQPYAGPALLPEPGATHLAQLRKYLQWKAGRS